MEIVSVIRTRDEPLHRMPDGVVLKALADMRPVRFPWLPRQRSRARLSKLPSKVVPKSEPRYRLYNAYTDQRLEQYLQGLQHGAVVAMQPGVTVAVASRTPESVVRVAQEHFAFRRRVPELREELRSHVARLDQFLTLTRTDAQLYRRYFRRAVPVRRLPNPALAHHAPFSDHTNKVVIAAGRLERIKGFDRLLEAWAIVHAKHPDWKLRIFGQGSQRESLLLQAEALELGDSVELPGFSTSLPTELAESSIYALTSRNEAYPMVLLEAMAAGVPAVAMDCPSGPRDIMNDGVNGFLLRNGDADGLAGRIIELIDDPDARMEMGRHALETAHSHNLAETAGEWERMLRRLKRKKQRQAG